MDTSQKSADCRLSQDGHASSQESLSQSNASHDSFDEVMGHLESRSGSRFSHRSYEFVDYDVNENDGMETESDDVTTHRIKTSGNVKRFIPECYTTDSTRNLSSPSMFRSKADISTCNRSVLPLLGALREIDSSNVDLDERRSYRKTCSRSSDYLFERLFLPSQTSSNKCECKQDVDFCDRECGKENEEIESDNELEELEKAVNAFEMENEEMQKTVSDLQHANTKLEATYAKLKLDYVERNFEAYKAQNDSKFAILEARLMNVDGLEQRIKEDSQEFVKMEISRVMMENQEMSDDDSSEKTQEMIEMKRVLEENEWLSQDNGLLKKCMKAVKKDSMDIKDENYELKRKVESLLQEKESLSCNVAGLEMEKDALQVENNELKKNKEVITRENDSLKDRASDFKKNLGFLNQKTEESRIEADKLRKENSKLKEKNGLINETNVILQKEASFFKEMITDLRKVKEESKVKIDQLKLENSELKKDKNIIVRENEDLKRKARDVAEEMDLLKQIKEGSMIEADQLRMQKSVLLDEVDVLKFVQQQYEFLKVDHEQNTRFIDMVTDDQAALRNWNNELTNENAKLLEENLMLRFTCAKQSDDLKTGTQTLSIKKLAVKAGNLAERLEDKKN